MNEDGIFLKKLRQARGDEPADIVIKKVTTFHLSSGELRRGDIAICGDTIVGVDDSYDGTLEIDGSSLTAVPGFIDAHIHPESTMMHPYEFERAVLPFGTTSMVLDPAGVIRKAGNSGLDFLMNSAAGMLTDVKIVHNSYSEESLKEIEFQPENVFCGGKSRLSGKRLNAFQISGMPQEHFIQTLDEAFERLRKGINIQICDGCIYNNLDVLAPLLTIENSPFLCFCSDFCNIPDIRSKGHIDYMIRRAIAYGADPLAVYRIASYSAARIFDFPGRGLIAPGYKADIVFVGYLDKCDVKMVIKNGKIVEDKLFAGRRRAPSMNKLETMPELLPFSSGDFRIPGKSGKMKPIHLSAGVSPSAQTDAVKVAVIRQDGERRSISLGFLADTGLETGAVASSFGKGCRNITVCGKDDREIAAAVNRVIEMRGGIAVAKGGAILASMPLPFAGIFSDMGYEELADELLRIRNAVSFLGNVSPDFYYEMAVMNSFPDTVFAVTSELKK